MDGQIDDQQDGWMDGQKDTQIPPNDLYTVIKDDDPKRFIMQKCAWIKDMS